MSCNICGRNACASWMHSTKEQEDWESVSDMSERQLQAEVVDLRNEIADLKAEIKRLEDNDI